MFSVALLTRQMKLVRLGGSRRPIIATKTAAATATVTGNSSFVGTTSIVPFQFSSLQEQQQYRNFATKKYRKPSEEKSVKRQRIQARKKKNRPVS